MRRAAVLLALAACQKAQPDEDPGPARLEGYTPAQIEAFTDHALDVYDALATAGERAGADCAKMAADLTTILDREGETLHNAVQTSSDPAFQAAARPILVARAERTKILTVRLETAFEPCAEDPVVSELLLALE